MNCPVCNIALNETHRTINYKMYCEICESYCLVDDDNCIFYYCFYFPTHGILSSNEHTKITNLYNRDELILSIDKFMPINTVSDIEPLINRLMKLKALS